MASFYSLRFISLFGLIPIIQFYEGYYYYTNFGNKNVPLF